MRCTSSRSRFYNLDEMQPLFCSDGSFYYGLRRSPSCCSGATVRHRKARRCRCTTAHCCPRQSGALCETTANLLNYCDSIFNDMVGERKTSRSARSAHARVTSRCSIDSDSGPHQLCAQQGQLKVFAHHLCIPARNALASHEALSYSARQCAARTVL